MQKEKSSHTISHPFEYARPDTYVEYHVGDPDLDYVKIELPKLEEFYSKHLERDISYDEAITMVDGYGLRPDKQFFKRSVMPTNLYKLQASIATRNDIKVQDVTKEDLFNELFSNRIYYKNEIAWIYKQIFRKYYGYWFFNNGKPTYITGRHYQSLNFWWINNGGLNDNYPYYRDKVRRKSIFYEYAYGYTKKRYKHKVNFRTYNEVGEPIIDFRCFNHLKSANEFRKQMSKTGFAFHEKPPEGQLYFEEETGTRTVNGVCQPKSRREGYTTDVVSDMFWIITSEPGKEAFIQALTEQDSKEEVFQKKMVEPIYRMPFFLQPYHDNVKNIKPSEDYNFNYPQSLLALETAGIIPQSLGSTIRTFTSSYRAVDGKRAGVIYRDEAGKMPDNGSYQDVQVWWNNVAKRTTMVGNKIVGFAMIGSTTGDMSGGGGAAYKRLCDQSHFNKLSDNGTTESGLWNIFFPAYDGLEGFIDKYGMSVIDDPSTPVEGQNGELIRQGAKSYLKNIRDSFFASGNMRDYINETREMPWTWAEAFTPSVSDGGMPIKELTERYRELIFSDTLTYIKCRLAWIDPSNWNRGVEIIPDEDGPWVINKEFYDKYPSELLNQVSWNNYEGWYEPSIEVCDINYSGLDPFRFNNENTVKKGKKSKGAYAVYMKKNERFSFSDDFLATYNVRTDNKDLFCEETLKATILWGCHVNIEIDEPVAVEYYQKHNYKGYLIHNVDPVKLKLSDIPGVRASETNKQSMFATMMTFFKRNHYRVSLPQVIEPWTKIESTKELTKYDICAATGWAIEAIKSPEPQEAKEERASQFFFNQESYD